MEKKILVNQVLEQGVEKFEVRKDAFDYLQEGVDHKKLENIYIAWEEKQVINEQELELAKKEINELVKVRLGIANRSLEISYPLTTALSKFKAHGEGLNYMVRTVEDRIKSKTLAYETAESQRIEDEYNAKKKVIDNSIDSLAEEFLTVKTSDDCNFLLEQVKKIDFTLDLESEEQLHDYFLSRKNELVGKIHYMKIQILEKNEADAKQKVKDLENENAILKETQTTVPELKSDQAEERKFVENKKSNATIEQVSLDSLSGDKFINMLSLFTADKVAYKEALNSLKKEELYTLQRTALISNPHIEVVDLVNLILF